MTIKFRNFTLSPGNSKDRFDIIQTRVEIADKNHMGVKSGKRKIGDRIEITDEVAYDVLLENAIDLIIRLELATRDECTDVRGYISAYVKEKNEILNILKK